VFGQTEVPKPVTTRPIGRWFRTDAIEINGPPNDDFHPNRLGHPVILVNDLAA
jgi:hypothetical protein